MKFAKTLLALAVVGAAFSAQAESNFVTTGNAVAKLDFEIRIPRVLYLAVGTGAIPAASLAIANNAIIDKLTFDLTAAGAPVVGSGTATTAQTTAVRVIGNNGQVTLTSTTSGQMNDGAGNVIPWTEITPATSSATIPNPGFNNGVAATNVSGAQNVTLNTGSTKLTNASANWTFAYANTAVYAPGTYGGTAANNGRVTYTATMP
jgi:hypothetical protein